MMIEKDIIGTTRFSILLRITGKLLRLLFVVCFAFIVGFLLICVLFFRASVRSPYAAAQAETRILMYALDTYYLDHNEFPKQLIHLTTPVAYLATIPFDPCSEGHTETFSYYTESQGYIVISRGPDCVFQIDPAQEFQFTENLKNIAPALLDKMYDPSNGSVSAGDIFRIGPYVNIPYDLENYKANDVD